MKDRSGPSTRFPLGVGLVIAAASGVALLLHGSGEDGIRGELIAILASIAGVSAAGLRLSGAGRNAGAW